LYVVENTERESVDFPAVKFAHDWRQVFCCGARALWVRERDLRIASWERVYD